MHWIDGGGRYWNRHQGSIFMEFRTWLFVFLGGRGLAVQWSVARSVTTAPEPSWTNGQHGYQIECLDIMCFSIGLDWGADLLKDLQAGRVDSKLVSGALAIRKKQPLESF